MTAAIPCRLCGRLACAAACFSLSTSMLGRSLHAQPAVAQAPPISTVTAVTIGGVFVTAPMQPMLNAVPTGNACGPDCYRGTITVRANQRWQLQVRLDPAIPLPATVFWAPGVAGSTGERLEVAWLTILTGPVPTAGTEVALQFAVSPTAGPPPSEEPFHQLLSMAVQYRVIPLP
jgi:hypothetical protein